MQSNFQGTLLGSTIPGYHVPHSRNVRLDTGQPGEGACARSRRWSAPPWRASGRGPDRWSGVRGSVRRPGRLRHVTGFSALGLPATLCGHTPMCHAPTFPNAGDTLPYAGTRCNGEKQQVACAWGVMCRHLPRACARARRGRCGSCRSPTGPAGRPARARRDPRACSAGWAERMHIIRNQNVAQVQYARRAKHAHDERTLGADTEHAL